MKKIMFNDRFGLTEAVLSGRKTQTRRIAAIPKGYDSVCVASGRMFAIRDGSCEMCEIFPKYKVGEVVAVAQSYKDAGWKKGIYRDTDEYIWLYTDGRDQVESVAPAGWGNKMFVKPELMPHKIRITRVWAEYLNNISDADCMAEGIMESNHGTYYFEIKKSRTVHHIHPRYNYAALIDRMCGYDTWEGNPAVWCYEFELY